MTHFGEWEELRIENQESGRPLTGDPLTFARKKFTLSSRAISGIGRYNQLSIQNISSISETSENQRGARMMMKCDRRPPTAEVRNTKEARFIRHFVGRQESSFRRTTGVVISPDDRSRHS
ncbi:MAG TPA: hypothetical protein PK205_10835 [Promineifilum sp.]|nr:hypothetical protein [Promineifilum sp.]